MSNLTLELLAAAHISLTHDEYAFPHLPRRSFLGALGGIAACSVLSLPARAADEPHRKGRLKQSVTRGVFHGVKLDLDGMCREAARLGSWGIDLVDVPDFPVLKKHGLVPTMVHGGTGIKNGINDKKRRGWGFIRFAAVLSLNLILPTYSTRRNRSMARPLKVSGRERF